MTFTWNDEVFKEGDIVRAKSFDGQVFTGKITSIFDDIYEDLETTRIFRLNELFSMAVDELEFIEKII